MTEPGYLTTGQGYWPDEEPPMADAEGIAKAGGMLELARRYAKHNKFGSGRAELYPPTSRVMPQENSYTLAADFGESVMADVTRCDDCNQVFEDEEVDQCSDCGQHFCTECRPKHDEEGCNA